MKKVLSMVLAAIFCVTAVSFAGAAHALAAPSGKPVIEDVDYESNGRVEVDFTTNISVKNLKVTVKDNTGKTYRVTSARVKDGDEISFKINGMKRNRRYTFTVSGVKKRYGGGTYTKVSGSVGKVTRVNTSGADRAAIEKIKYDGGGLVEVDFRRNVNLRNVKITVKDSSGKKYATRIVERDEDELDFRVIGIQAGKKYTVTLAKVKSAISGRTATVTGSFTTPKASDSAIAVKKVEYDADDRELSIEFRRKVNLWDAQVKVTDDAGNNYRVRILDYDDDELEIRVYGLKAGRTYRYSVSGIYTYSGSSAAKTVQGTFRAIDDDWDDDWDD